MPWYPGGSLSARLRSRGPARTASAVSWTGRRRCRRPGTPVPAGGTTEQRKTLELGDPAEDVAAHQPFDDVVRAVGGPGAVALVLALLDAVESETDLVAVAAVRWRA